MKKILSALAFVIFAGIFNFCSADLLEYYQNHPDYEVYGGHQGYYAAVYLPSIHVEKYNPPHYQIGFNAISIVADVYKNGTKESTKWHYNQSKRYNWYTKETFSLQNGYWEKDNVGGDDYYIRMKEERRRLADILFRAAYGMDFYGY